MVAVTRLCDKKQQVALLLICANVETERAEVAITQHKSAQTKAEVTTGMETKPHSSKIHKSFGDCV